MKRLLISLLVATFLIFSTPSVFAASSYVLPYPSTMPGGISYKIHLIWEKLMQFWYFGDLGQFEYNLQESDKYLVQAKTLFEYNQYLLGYQALEKSNTYLGQTLPHLIAAKNHGIDIADKRALLSSAAEKHIETLTVMKNETPNIFTWTPEKTAASTLEIHKLIDASIGISNKDL